MRKNPSLLPAASSRPGNLPAQAVASVLAKSAGPSRLLHDTGIHRERISTMAAAMDGTHLVTASTDGTVRLWDAASGQCIRVFDCRNCGPSGLFVSPTRPRMVTAAPLGWKKIWNLADGKCLAVLTDHPGIPVHCDDTFFYCKQNWIVHNFLDKKSRDSQRSEVILYNIDNGERVRTFKIEGSHIVSLKVSPDSALIAAVNSDLRLRIWNAESGELLHRSAPEISFQKIVGISPDSRFIVVKSASGVTVLNRAEFSVAFAVTALQGNYRAQYALRGFQLIEKQRAFIHPHHLSEFRIFDIRTGAMFRTGTFTGDLEIWSFLAEEGLCLEFPDGRVNVWNIRAHAIAASYPLNPDSPGWTPGVAALLKGKEIALARQETVVRLVDPLSGKSARLIPAGDPVRDILITPDGRSLLTLGAAEGKLWDLSSGLCLKAFDLPEMDDPSGLPQGAPLAALTPDGKSLVAQAKDEIAVYDLSTGRQETGFPLAGPAGKGAEDRPQGPFALYVTADGKRLFVVSGRTGFLGAHDLRTGLSVAGFPLKGLERFNAFCMSGALLATAKDNALCLWDGRTGRLLHESRQDGRIGDIVMSAARQMVITVSAFELRFLDWETGALVKKHSYSSIGSARDRFDRWLTPLPDGGRFLVKGADLIALWNADTEDFVWREEVRRKNRLIRAAAFPDGERFATLDTAGVVAFRDVANGKVLAGLRVLPTGFIWETPPDDHAPAGWLWTDREDLVSVISRAPDDRDGSVFRRGASEHEAYLKIYNNRQMVMARIAGQAAYDRQIRFYNGILDTSRIGNSAGGFPAALLNE